MKAIVIYDSQFGNTEKIAQTIRDALSDTAETRLMRRITLKGEPVN